MRSWAARRRWPAELSGDDFRDVLDLDVAFQIGRGVREHRYIGKIKVMAQTELRADLFRLVLFRRAIDFGGAVFVDGAYLAADWDQLPGGLLGSGGVGVRILFNDSFVARLDIAASPFEERLLSISSAGGTPF